MIEQLHVEGDHYVQELATVGYLEALQNRHYYQHDAHPADLEVFLGPESRRWWRGVRAFWEEGRIPIQPIDDPDEGETPK